MIDDEEIMEPDDYNPELNKMIDEVCYIIDLSMNELATSAQPLDALVWFGTYFNISLYDKNTQIRQNQIYGTYANTENTIRSIMKKMKRPFTGHEYHYGYWGWKMTLDELQELHDLLKKRIQAPFV